MQSQRPREESIRWFLVDQDADTMLADQIREAGLGEPQIGRLCPHCGSSQHGRPWVRAGSVEIPVSISRAGDYLVTVVGAEGVTAVGIDLEVDAPNSTAWVTKEAIAKAVGLGIGHPDAAPAEFDGELRPVDAPEGYVAAIALRR